MSNRNLILLLVLLALAGTFPLMLFLSRVPPGRRLLSPAAQAGIIRQEARAPLLWRGWTLLHDPDPRWTDPAEEPEGPQPVADLLSPPDPHFLVDGSGTLTPAQAAREAVRGLLHSIKANRSGEGFQILDYRVGPQRLLRREDVVERALARCGSPELSGRTAGQLKSWCRSFFGAYPGLGKDMWLVEPDFALKWSGTIRSVSYESCVEQGLADREGFVALRKVFPAPVFLLIQRGSQYRFQSADAFFRQYPEAALRLRDTAHGKEEHTHAF